MPVFPHYPDNYLHFNISEVIRGQPLQDVYHRHGAVWYTPLSGQPLLEARISKMVKELKETIDAAFNWEVSPAPDTRKKLLEELTDVSDILQEIATHCADTKCVDQANSLPHALNQWQGYLQYVHEGKQVIAKIPEAIALTSNGIDKFVRTRGITDEELRAARLEKRANKGTYLRGRVDFISLPENDEWIPAYRRKYSVVNGLYLSPPPPMHPHILTHFP